MPTRTTQTLGLLSGITQPFAVPGRTLSFRAPITLIHPLSCEALGDELAGQALNNFGGANAYPAANRGIGYPFVLADYFLVQKVWWLNGGTVGTDTIDVAVYTEAGGANSQLVAGGGAVAAGANVVQEINVTDTLLPPGRYWCVHAQSGTTATTMASPAAAANLRAAGVAQMASASTAGVLGTTWTPAAAASAYLAFFGIANRTQVA